jgi:hypothetical protein
MDELDAERRQRTAAAYGFESWEDFREWRRRNPLEHRARSRLLTTSKPAPSESRLVLDLFGRARRVRGEDEASQQR